MLPVSAISDAASKLRTLLLTGIDDLVDVKQIRIGHPKDTLADMDNEKDKNHLNLFFYNVTYDGYPADGLSNDPIYVRIHCLITAVGAKTGVLNAPSPGENDLRLIGEVMRILHEQPVVNVGRGPNDIVAQLQIVPLSLNLDDLNHIWSTQADTAYRLSVAYELALAPVPLAAAVGRSPLVAAIGTLARADMDQAPLPDGGFGIDTHATTVAAVSVDAKKQPGWSPHIYLYDVAGKRLRYTLLVPRSQLPQPGPLQLKVLAAGEPSAQVELVWETWDSAGGRWERSAASQPVSINTGSIDPEKVDPGLATDVPLPLQDAGQATLHAERLWTRPDGSTVTLRSNPLLVTVTKAGT